MSSDPVEPPQAGAEDDEAALRARRRLLRLGLYTPPAILASLALSSPVYALSCSPGSCNPPNGCPPMGVCNPGPDCNPIRNCNPNRSCNPN